MSLENWIRNKLQEIEEMQDYSVATDTVRCWIDEYNDKYMVSAFTENVKNEIIKL